MTTEQKTIILGMPADNQIYRVIEAALEYHGFNVVSVVMDNLNFRYENQIQATGAAGQKRQKRL